MNQKITLMKKVHNVTTNNNNKCNVEKNYKKKELSSFRQALFCIISQPIKTTKNAMLRNAMVRSIAIIMCCLLKWTTTETTINMSLFSSIR